MKSSPLLIVPWIITFIVCVWAASVVYSVVASVRPTSRDGEVFKVSQHDPKEYKDQPSIIQRGSQESPVIVRIVRTEEDKQATQKNERYADENAALQRRQDKFNLILALCGLAQVVIIISQFRIMRSQRDAQHSELRAYVSIQITGIFFDDQAKLNATAKLVNYGQTPAHNVSARVDIIARPERIGTEFDLPEIRNGWAPSFVIFPNANTVEQTPYSVTQPASRELAMHYGDIMSLNQIFYILGEVTYLDAFKRKQSTKCCVGVSGLPAQFNIFFVEVARARMQFDFKVTPMGNTAT